MPSRSRQSADNLVQLVSSLAIAAGQQAVVSPCSECKNQRAVEADGKPACPRRYWRQWIAQSPDQVDESYNLLNLTGSEGKDAPEALRNPVYSDSDHHIMVWVAKLGDNRATYDQDGKLLTTNLLNRPAFDTDYIQCEQYPFVVRENEASYFQHGSYREWDQLETTGIRDQHLVQDEKLPVRVGGFARKVDFAYNFNRQKVEKDLCPRGT